MLDRMTPVVLPVDLHCQCARAHAPCRRAAALVTAAVALHGSVPAVQCEAPQLQAQIQAAWQTSAWMEDDSDDLLDPLDPGAAAPAPAPPAAARPAAPLAATVLQWATLGPSSGAQLRTQQKGCIT